MNDDTLLAAIARGDDTALRELFNRHAPWLASRLRRSLPADAVEDVLQETFLAVWSGAHRFSGKGAAGAWLWGIARNQAGMWARKNGRAAPEIMPRASDDPASTAATRVDLQRALRSLGPDGSEPRELLRLVYVEDRPVKEVARILGVPSGTVKSRLFALRQRLRAALAHEGD